MTVILVMFHMGQSYNSFEESDAYFLCVFEIE